MGAYIYNDGDRTVATIAVRDSISTQFEGMVVTVQDAIADIRTGGGVAKYQWNALANRWMLIWKETVDNLNFFNDSSVVTNGKATCTHYPSSQVVWNALIVDPAIGAIIAEFNQPPVSGTDINLGTNAYDGKVLYFTYAYGAIEAAIHEIVSDSIGW